MAADRQRLAQALAAEAARRKMFESIPEAAGQGLPQAPERPMGWNDYLENLSIGLGRGAVSNLEGIKGMVTSPVETLKGVATGVTEAVRNPRMVAEALKQTGQRAMSGPLGLGEVIGENVNMMRVPGKPVMHELDVYHGTPHRFPATEANPLGEFDASKIGTGEGAQAYGHGIYYAESPNVAKGYQSTLRQTNAWEIDGQRVHGVRSRSDAQPINYAANALERFDGDKKAAIAWLKDSENPWDLEAAQLLAKSKTAKKAPGSLYKADLPDEMINRMLDWDKPLNEQSDAVKAILQKSGLIDELKRYQLEMGMNPRVTDLASGNNLYEMLGRKLKPSEKRWRNALGEATEQQAASQRLRELGIPGIAYLDAGSRGAGGTGTRNFVVFPGEEKKVRILERK